MGLGRWLSRIRTWTKKPRNRSLGGMKLVASFPKPSAPPTPSDECRIEVIEKKPIHFKCGHDGPEQFKIILYGRAIGIGAKRKGETCPDCSMNELKRIACRCAQCGAPILPGEPVALYGDDGSFDPKLKTLVNGKAVIGCMDWDCCPFGGFFAGHWTDTGFKGAFGEHGSAAGMAVATGKVIEVNLK